MKYAATGEIAAEIEVCYSARTAAKPVRSIPSPLPRFLLLLRQVHPWIDMLAVAQPYFESNDFCGDVILYAAFPHPLLKYLIGFECGLDRFMRTDDRTDALFRYFEPRVYQRNRAHKVQLCKASLLVNQRERR
jgi:hypothetical protein